jgi:hypothetical protein
MRSRPVFALAALLAAFAVAAPRASAEKFELAVATDSKEVVSQHDSFSPSTARIYVVYKIALSKASRVKAAWVTEKVEGYQDNNKFGESGSNLDAGTYMSSFSYARPGAAWPAGAYRVDLYVDDKVERSVRFKVAK